MAIKGNYSAGKKSGTINNGLTHNMGKKSGLASKLTNVTHDAGKNSGTRRNGDSSSCAPMGGKGGKSY